MYTFVSPVLFSRLRSRGLRGELGAGIALGIGGSLVSNAISCGGKVGKDCCLAMGATSEYECCNWDGDGVALFV